MNKKLAVLLAGGAVAVAAGVLYSRSRGSLLPGATPPPIASVLDAPLATKDSTKVAEFAHQRCRFASDRQPCYDEVFLAIVERGEVRLAMDALSVLARLDPGTVAKGHDYTHVVGINAWTPGKNVSEVYEQCTGLYQSGCYHGVVQAYLDANGTDSATVGTVCNLIRSAVDNMWLRFQCVHGIGHGLVNALSMHLPNALKGCDWLVDGWDATSCYGGAFMEFIVAGRGQSHHPHAKKAATTDEHAAHEHHEPADSFAVRNKSDPLYPCSVIGQKYQPACYGMQAGIIIEIVGADFGKIAQACDGAPVGMRPSCYQGIGTYVSGYTVRNSRKSIEFCNEGNEAYKPWCFVGVVKNFIDVTSKPDDGFDFCRRVHDQLAVATSCYVAIGEEMAVLFPVAEDRARECAKAGAVFVGACRYGAALSTERPANLPVVIQGT